MVATAHLYCGQIAQTEWLSQLIGFSGDDRARALSYIKGVRSRLQQIHVLRWRDVVLCLAAAVTVFLVTYLPSREQQYSQIESLLVSVILLLVTSLLMFYLLLQRWQHIRRLIELEEVFEELLPAKTPGVRACGRRSRALVPRAKCEVGTHDGEKSNDGVSPRAVGVGSGQ